MTMDHDSQAGPKPAAGLTFGRLKHLLHLEFETYDRGFKGALSGMHGSWQHYSVSRSARFGIAPWLMAALVLCLASVALAFNFPPLTGRVVDQANIMSVQSRNDLEAKLKELENKSGIQLVVATVKSLDGSDVETYANELFRNWKLGEAKKNNGIVLLVAPTEHKVRIEVGYGLEGTLTDALSSVIISSAIVPRFKANDFTGGIERGVDGIISVLSGDTADWQPKPSVRAEDSPQLSNELFSILFLLIVVFVVWSLIRGVRGTSSGRYVRGGGGMIFLPTGRSWGSSGRSGGFGGGGGGFGGGFSSGGGWSGGGGASGSW
jgi:uncharacterized protein